MYVYRKARRNIYGSLSSMMRVRIICPLIMIVKDNAFQYWPYLPRV
jgi:hypothetical protein